MTDPDIQIDQLSTEELEALAKDIPARFESLRVYGKKAQTAEYWGEVSLFSHVIAELFRRRWKTAKDDISEPSK